MFRVQAAWASLCFLLVSSTLSAPGAAAAWSNVTLSRRSLKGDKAVESAGLIDQVEMIYKGSQGCYAGFDNGVVRRWCGAKCGLGYNVKGPSDPGYNGWIDDTDRCCRDHDISLGFPGFSVDISATSKEACPIHKAIAACLNKLPKTITNTKSACLKRRPYAFWCSTYKTQSSCGGLNCIWGTTSEVIDTDAAQMASGFEFLMIALRCD